MADSGYSRQTLPQLITTIRNDVLTRLSSDSTLAQLRRSDAEVYSRVQAAAVHTVYGYIDYLARNLLPDLADEDWLTRHGNMKRVTRKAAVAASGYVRWDGATDGLKIDEGVIIQRDDLVSFTTTSAATATRMRRSPGSIPAHSAAHPPAPNPFIQKSGAITGSSTCQRPRR